MKSQFFWHWYCRILFGAPFLCAHKFLVPPSFPPAPLPVNNVRSLITQTYDKYMWNVEANLKKGKFPWSYETKLSSNYFYFRSCIIFPSELRLVILNVLRNDLFKRICHLWWSCLVGNQFTLALSFLWPQEATRRFCNCFGRLSSSTSEAMNLLYNDQFYTTEVSFSELQRQQIYSPLHVSFLWSIRFDTTFSLHWGT